MDREGSTIALEAARRFEVRQTPESHFAWLRTRLSLERTLMSWVRTATALIGFGFAIVQYFDRLSQTPGTRAPYFPAAPRYLGLALIASGVLALLVAIAEYRWATRYLAGEPFTPIAGVAEGRLPKPVLGVAILLTAIGLFAFFAVLFRLT